VVGIGLLLLAGALGAAGALVMQNRGEGSVRVHVFGNIWDLQPHWILVAGAGVAVIAMIGAVMMQVGAARSREIRRERDELLAENARLNGRTAESESSFFFDEQPDGPATTGQPVPEQRGLFRGTPEYG
jgi:hypothetical protein